MKINREPIISVCIANYNGAEVIGPCIESVFSQEGDITVEVIIHDDASTDGSIDFIRKHYPSVRLILSKVNVGFCTGNNRMVRESSGKYILLLNNDAVLHHDALKTLLSYADGLGTFSILSLPQYDIRTKDLIDIGSLLDPFINAVPNKNPARHHVGMVSGACLWIHKDLWNELGGFPDKFEYLAEDAYLCFKARLWGYPVQAIPKSGFDHWMGNSLGGGKIEQDKLSTTYLRRFHSESNKISVMAIFFPTFLLGVVMPLHLLLFTMEGILLSLLKCDYAIWRNIYSKTLIEVWQRRIWLIKERIVVQKKRRIGLINFCSIISWYPYKLKMFLSYGLPSLGKNGNSTSHYNK